MPEKTVSYGSIKDVPQCRPIMTHLFDGLIK
jgi:hypothetical protein